MDAPAAELTWRCYPESGCITCSDEAVAMIVRRVDGDRGLALCEDPAGGRSTVEIALVEPVTTGDRVLVHAGTAIQTLEREAG